MDKDKINEYVSNIDGKNKGQGLELITLKMLSKISKIQKKGLKKYELSNYYTSFKLRIGGHQYYEQDVMAELSRKYGVLKPFHKFFQSFKNIHSTSNLIIQCKNYDGKVDAQHVDHDLVQIGMGGIIGFNLPIHSVIVMDEDNPVSKYRFKRRYHILDIVKDKDFDVSYLNSDFDSIDSNSHFIALRDFGKIQISYNSIKDIDNVSIDDIIKYVNNKRSKLVKFDKYRFDLGNLVLAFHKGRLEFINVIKYSNNISEDFTTINDEEELRRIIVNSWKFLNPELVFYLAENGITKRGIDHINRVGANVINLFELINNLKKGRVLNYNRFKFDINHDFGRKMSANLEIRFLDNLDMIVDENRLTKKEWDNAYSNFAYKKIKRSNFSIIR